MREQPTGLQPPDFSRPDPDKTTQVSTHVRKYRLITPLFGGGVVPIDYDPITIVRGSAIRGQLRFWWRACRGGRFNGDLAAMQLEEGKIWGKAYKKDEEATRHENTIQILVEALERGRPIGARDLPPYAAFPLQQLPQKTLLQNVSFQLTISFPGVQKSEIEAALWAWETFGGLGARTRRGFGALQLLGIEIGGKKQNNIPPANPQSVKDRLKKEIAEFVLPGTFPIGVPHLSQASQLYITSPAPNPMTAWRALIKKLAEFRQAPYGRDKRSHWPEAEAIREYTGHRHYKALGHPRKFPRAAFGLPIIFHFKDSRSYTNPDPKDTSLQGENTERLASPLILRPLACAGGQAVGLAMILEVEGGHLPPGRLILKEIEEKNKGPYPVEAQLTRAEAEKLNIPVLRTQQNVLKAFITYLGDNKV